MYILWTRTGTPHNGNSLTKKYWVASYDEIWHKRFCMGTKDLYESTEPDDHCYLFADIDI